MAQKQYWSSDRESLDRSIASARGGSFAALGQLFDHYRDYLLRTAKEELASKLAPKVSPSDVVQETFLDAAKGFPQFNGQTEAELKAWLRNVLLNNIRDARRRYFGTQKRAAALEIPLPTPGEDGAAVSELRSQQSSISAPLVRAEEVAALRHAMSRLPDDQRRVIELKTYQAMKFEQIGVELGRSAEAVRKLWVRGIEKLAIDLEQANG